MKTNNGKGEVPPTPRPNRDPSEPVTSGTTDTPPKRTTRAAPKDAPREAPPRATPGRKPVLQKKLEELFASPALIYSFAGDEYAAHIIATRTPPLAEAWYQLAQENAAVKRILTRLVEGSAWGGVVLSSAAVAIPLLVHHGLIPEIPDPFVSLYPPLPDEARGPIVPPPPSAEAPRPPGPTYVAGEGPLSGMTPPIADGQPPGVVTVAGTNSNARNG